MSRRTARAPTLREGGRSRPTVDDVRWGLERAQPGTSELVEADVEELHGFHALATG
jgi:hypothetical protein